MQPAQCTSRRRVAQVRASALNGIDFLEVDDLGPAPEQRFRRLRVRCVKPDGLGALGPAAVRIEGGERLRDIAVLAAGVDPSRPDELVVDVDRAGDFSRYTLRLVGPQGGPPSGFDPPLAEIGFSFRIDCLLDQDCLPPPCPPAPPAPAPELDYLSKDYASFRALMLDRLALKLPAWTERNPADVGVTIVEALAYAADLLSQRQDAAATEAYLDTAQRRSSVRRHARLLDYRVHAGCNARAWVCLEVHADHVAAGGAALPAGTLLLTGLSGEPLLSGADRLLQAQARLSSGAVGFETVHPLRDLRVARNRMRFHTWSDERCCLPPGSTRAHVRAGAAELALRAGDVVVLEELAGPDGRAVDADPANRQAVRLVRDPVELHDAVEARTVTELEWHPEDALRFALRLDEVAGEPLGVVRGNVVLADHGVTHGRDERALAAELEPEEPGEGRTRPRLGHADLTHRERAIEAPAAETSAAGLLRRDPRAAEPRIELFDGTAAWQPRPDLLASGRFDPHFVVELEDDGHARLRFGDGVHGRRPAGRRLSAVYRVGNGHAGNVGAGALSAVVAALPPGLVARVWNPLPAQGGVDPEPTEDVRLYAPQAYRAQRRAVTEEDYARAAEAFPGVQRAVARRRFTGSWTTIYVAVDRGGGLPVDAPFERGLAAHLDRFRMAGYDVEVEPPLHVALDVALSVCVAPGHVAAQVRTALLEALGARRGADGRAGYFHPDRFTFGQPVLLSDLVAAAMAVPGVRWVDLDPHDPRHRFQRLGELPRGELEDGRIALGPREIARLDNDPNAPERGRLELHLEGGA